MLSTADEYPIHQVAETIRNVGTSDRNFYDRYYFNLHASSDELFMVTGMGQYPNLGVADAFVCISHGDTQYVGNPRILSYHQTWFELHQDLMDSLGIARSE